MLDLKITSIIIILAYSFYVVFNRAVKLSYYIAYDNNRRSMSGELQRVTA